jgi:hypothetical protein
MRCGLKPASRLADKEARRMGNDGGVGGRMDGGERAAAVAGMSAASVVRAY